MSEAKYMTLDEFMQAIKTKFLEGFSMYECSKCRPTNKAKDYISDTSPYFIRCQDYNYVRTSDITTVNIINYGNISGQHYAVRIGTKDSGHLTVETFPTKEKALVFLHELLEQVSN